MHEKWKNDRNRIPSFFHWSYSLIYYNSKFLDDKVNYAPKFNETSVLIPCNYIHVFSVPCILHPIFHSVSSFHSFKFLAILFICCLLLGPSVPVPKCRDKRKRKCKRYAKFQGYCTVYREYMSEMCPRSCKFCGKYWSSLTKISLEDLISKW